MLLQPVPAGLDLDELKASLLAVRNGSEEMCMVPIEANLYLACFQR